MADKVSTCFHMANELFLFFLGIAMLAISSNISDNMNFDTSNQN